jgi:hypothetical protein
MIRSLIARTSVLAVVAIAPSNAAAAVDDRDCAVTPMAQGENEPRTGDAVEWIDFPAQKELNDPAWGPFLTDVENHLPIGYGSTYRDSDYVTWCHETTHGINSHIRNRFGGAGRNGFYVGSDRAAVVDEPRLTIGQVAEAIPLSLRGNRFESYLVSQRSSWDLQPLYLWDEWVAYTNGAQTAVDQAPSRRNERRDWLMGMLEFNVYSLYVAKLAQENGSDSKQLIEFFAWNWRRSMKLWESGMRHETLNWDNGAYLRRMLGHPEIREFLQKNRIPAPEVD